MKIHEDPTLDLNDLSKFGNKDIPQRITESRFDPALLIPGSRWAHSKTNKEIYIVNKLPDEDYYFVEIDGKSTNLTKAGIKNFIEDHDENLQAELVQVTRKMPPNERLKYVSALISAVLDRKENTSSLDLTQPADIVLMTYERAKAILDTKNGRSELGERIVRDADFPSPILPTGKHKSPINNVLEATYLDAIKLAQTRVTLQTLLETV